MRARRRPATLGIAVGGVLSGHWLTYVAVAPTEEARAAILHHTGGRFFVDAPVVVFPISLQDTGSGVFATALSVVTPFASA